MAYQALYREWRPQTFADVVGQPHIVRTLQNMLRQGRVYHAFLFCGPRGTGKTTLAKLLAKALNCQQGPTTEPCQTCAACLGIKAGNYVDVLEIDGASNRGIDEIRELRERVKYAPAEGRYKVYIIDEVHMLTTEAFNALLKTLEEPPAHVVFVFATTEVQKVPATILSRCQRFDFRRIGDRVIEDALVDLCRKAVFAVEPEALRLIAAAANGGMRDALSMLDQARSYAGEQTLTAADVQEVIGLVSDATFRQLLTHLVQGDLQSALENLSGLIERGREVAQIADGFVQYARSCLLHSVGLAPEGFVPPAVDASPAFLTSLLQALLAVEKEIRYASNQRVLLELALFRASHPLALAAPATQTQSMPGTAQPMSVPESPESKRAAHPETVEPATAELVRVDKADSVALPLDVDNHEAVEDKGASRQDEVILVTDREDSTLGLTLRRLRQRWPDFVAKVASEDPSIGAPLANGQIKQLSDSVIVLQFEKGFHRKVVNDNLRLIEELLQAELHQPLRLSCLLQSENPAVEQVEDRLSVDDAEKIALSLFEGQEVDSNQMGGPKSNE